MSNCTGEDLNHSLVRGSVNMHRFKPSGTVIWTMVGKDREHWVDVELGFCSCKRYYYRTLSDGQKCYHLGCVELARKTQKFTTIDFHDSERKFVIDAIISDLRHSLLPTGHADYFPNYSRIWLRNPHVSYRGPDYYY